MGTAPAQVRWSGDSSKIYFQWKKAADPAASPLDTYVVNRDGTGLRKLSDDEVRLVTPANADMTEDRAWSVFSQDGDIVLVENATGKRRQLTKTVGRGNQSALSVRRPSHHLHARWQPLSAIPRQRRSGTADRYPSRCRGRSRSRGARGRRRTRGWRWTRRRWWRWSRWRRGEHRGSQRNRVPGISQEGTDRALRSGSQSRKTQGGERFQNQSSHRGCAQALQH